MKILIDINHPAHVHYFKNFYKIMTASGHSILVVSRNKEIEHQLLNLNGIPFITRGKGRKGRIGKFLYLLYADIKLLFVALKFRPDVFLNFLHPYPSHVAKILGIPSLVFSDTEHAKLHHKLTVPFASKVLTPACYLIDLGKKHVRFNGYMELTYLHPNYFTPNPAIYEYLNMRMDEKYVVFRFVSWEAVHDFGLNGMTVENKRKAVSQLSKYAKVFISSEGKLPDDLEKFRINIPYDRMHDVLYYSSLIYSESATMTSEAAVLGTPSIFIFDHVLGYIEDEKKYGIVNQFSTSESDQVRALDKALEIAQDPGARERYRAVANSIVSNSADPTAFMVEEVLKYNSSSM